LLPKIAKDSTNKDDKEEDDYGFQHTNPPNTVCFHVNKFLHVTSATPSNPPRSCVGGILVGDITFSPDKVK